MLVPLLGIATASFVGAYCAASLGWPWATVLALAVAIGVVLLLFGARMVGFVWRHPTLARLHNEMAELDTAIIRGGKSDAEVKQLLERVGELTMVAAHEYLTDEQWSRVSAIAHGSSLVDE